MADMVRVAAIQMNSRQDKSANMVAAEELVERAAREGAQLIVLPELFNFYGELADVVAHAEPVPGPTSQRLSAIAARHQVYLAAGSICEQGESLAWNTSLLFNPCGEIAGCYRKIHLFDIDLPQVKVLESDHMRPGTDVVVTNTPHGSLGQAICYDLRFPELFRALMERSATIVMLPAAFTRTTGRDHWQVLLRARAIENQSFVIAANQCGDHTSTLSSYGHSQIIDPWGAVLIEASADSPQVIVADLDMGRLTSVRERLPCLQHRRLTVEPRIFSTRVDKCAAIDKM